MPSSEVIKLPFDHFLVVLQGSNDVFWNLEVQIPLVRKCNCVSSPILSQVIDFYILHVLQILTCFC